MELEIQFHDVSFTHARPQASIHLKGKLGFNKDAAKLLGLHLSPIFMVGTPPNSTEGDVLYLVEVDEEKGASTVKTAKAGKYFYLSIKGFFDKLKIPYTEYSISYDIEKGSIKGRPLYTLTRKRMNHRKDKTAKATTNAFVPAPTNSPF